MRQFAWVMALTLVMILGLGSGAAAEQRAGSFTISPFLGGYAFDSDLNLEDDYTYGLGLGYNFDKNWATELSFNYAETELDSGDADVDTYLYRLDALYHFMPEKPFVPYVAAGIGAFDFESGNSVADETEASGNFGAGIKYFLNDSMALRADVRNVMTFPENTQLYTAGVTFAFGGEEKTAEKDTDGDGVLDKNDRCPRTPAGVKVDDQGCPIDTDEDGVPDFKDDCPDTPKGVEVDKSGCALDSDRDGVADYKDDCPGTPKRAEVDEKGCALDSDNDGVPDYKDECKETPQGANVNEKGCWVVENLQFETDKAEIRERFQEYLEQVVTVLEKNPEMNVEIRGHTDARGTEEYNQRLSERRATAVKDFLVKQGISESRLSCKGFGEADPIASNDTKQGRRKNRRVELKPIY
ncbi:MAG: outer membrane beta-barrel domain-containing protein [Desulfovermiculus sp.]